METREGDGTRVRVYGDSSDEVLDELEYELCSAIRTAWWDEWCGEQNADPQWDALGRRIDWKEERT